MGRDISDPHSQSPALTVGQRIRIARQRRGMSQEVLAGLMGKSPSWVRAVESGSRQSDLRLSILLHLADALQIENLSDLTGSQSVGLRMFTGPGHPALVEVRAAINAAPLLNSSEGQVHPLGVLRSRLDAAWRTRHASPDHRTALGRILPGLLRDVQCAVSTYPGGDRRRANALLAEVYGLVQMYVAYQPAQDLLWRVADRALLAAQESEDPLAIGCAVWFLTQAHRDTGDFDAARDINEQGIATLKPQLDSAGVDLLAMWGALHFELAFTAARLGAEGDAWRHWTAADRVAERLPPTYYNPVTSFSRVIMSAHAVTVAVELSKGAESARQSNNAEAFPIPSKPRRGRHLIEVARAHHLQRNHDAVLGTLQLAHQTASETIRYNGFARRMVWELVDSGPSRLQGQVRELAVQIGLMA
ncbi:helix-turn-helix transcriptional regulator [Nonomuraea longicatena]|uniref:HTH cro/C1-type domain-containing protein n=1 Tax=Nonomuraea longicatena TaxID=83682 RepID=A0ABN1R885_9ACTN